MPTILFPARPCAFAAADFNFSDPLGTPPNYLAAVKIATLPGAGSLKNNDANVSARQCVTVADLDAGRLEFTPAVNAHASGYL